MKKFLILITPLGKKYAGMISRSIIFQAKRDGEDVKVDISTPGCNMDGYSCIHPRTASPKAAWLSNAEKLQTFGVQVINSPATVRLTSDKMRCSDVLIRAGVSHPDSISYTKGDVASFESVLELLRGGLAIAKPTTSLSQGQHVTKFDLPNSFDEFERLVNGVPGKQIVVQRFVQYTGIHRVIVIGGVPKNFTFVDRVSFHPEQWKVSVCLSKTKRLVTNPPKDLLDVAVKAQMAVGGDINFIDVFETPDGYTMSEINTACSLIKHEKMAREAGVRGWNIHASIAKLLLRKTA
jgi:glutathione synthase/RimK-type ligase-like ATP-grasp enzyme